MFGKGRVSTDRTVARVRDASFGIAIGLGAATVADYLLGKLKDRGVVVPSILGNISPLLMGAATAGGTYALSRPGKDRIWLSVGALAGGAIAALSYAAEDITNAIVSDTTTVPTGVSGYGFSPRTMPAGMGFSPRTMPAGMGAPLFNNPRMQGMNGPIFNNPNVNLAGLARLQGLGDDSEDGIFSAP